MSQRNIHPAVRRLIAATWFALLASTVRSQHPGDGAWDHLEHFFDDANLTTVQPLKGYDVRKEYPGSPKSSWEVFIDLRDEVPYEALGYTAPGDQHKGKLRLLQRVGFRPTGDLVDKDGSIRTVDGWGFCYKILSLAHLNLTDDTDVKPNCEGAFSEECVKWLEDFHKDGKLCKTRKPREPHYSWNESPCRNYSQTNMWGTHTDMAPRYGNMSDLTSSGRGYIRQDPMIDGLEYDIAAKTVWYVSVGWMPGPVGDPDYTAFSEGPSGADGDLPSSAGVCLRHGMKRTTQNNSTEGGYRETSGKDGKNGSDNNEGSSEGDREDDTPDGAMGRTSSLFGVLGAVTVILAVNVFGL